MKFIQTETLTDEQKKEALALEKACREAEDLTLSVPTEDGLIYLLALKEGNEPMLLGLSYLLFSEQPENQETICEFAAFVHPKERRKGIFSQMLTMALDLADAYETDKHDPVAFCFLTDEKAPSALETLKAIEAEYWYSEHKMVREPRQNDEAYQPKVTIARPEEHLYTASLNEEVIGTCALLPCQKETYLYAFQIKEEFQGQGYGTDFLKGMLALLAPAKKPVSLQVSGMNYIARNLYKKAGFRTTESLSYYVY